MKLDRLTRGLLTAVALTSALVLLDTDGQTATNSKPTKSKVVAAAKPIIAANFTLADANGVKHSLSDYRGHPVALYFFCGCQWCEAVAGQWSTMQRAGALPLSADGKQPPTVIVFQGDAQAAKAFEQKATLDPANTVMLCDVDVDVTLKYDAEPCPRIFVLDPAGKVAYTNNHKDDKARVAPAAVIAGKALSALQKVAAEAPKKLG